MIPNWQKLGFDNREQSMKWILAKLYEHRKRILDLGLGGAYEGSKGTKHGKIDEIYETTFFLGNRVLILKEKGFENESNL